MRPPYFQITSRCDNDRCPIDTFQTQRKRMHYTSTAGAIETCTRQVCPSCRAWGYIIKAEEITA